VVPSGVPNGARAGWWGGLGRGGNAPRIGSMILFFVALSRILGY